jgi:hypothetical protein
MCGGRRQVIVVAYVLAGMALICCAVTVYYDRKTRRLYKELEKVINETERAWTPEVREWPHHHLNNMGPW